MSELSAARRPPQLLLLGVFKQAMASKQKLLPSSLKLKANEGNSYDKLDMGLSRNGVPPRNGSFLTKKGDYWMVSIIIYGQSHMDGTENRHCHTKILSAI